MPDDAHVYECSLVAQSARRALIAAVVVAYVAEVAGEPALFDSVGTTSRYAAMVAARREPLWDLATPFWDADFDGIRYWVP